MSKERMQQEREKTFHKILDASWDIAVKEGVNAISIRKIASALNFAPNNLYNYFANKNELLLYMKKDSYQWSSDIITNHKSVKNGFCNLFKEISEKLLLSALQEPEKYIVMTSNLIMDNQEEMDKQMTEFVAGKIKEGIAVGELADVDPVTTAVNLRMIQISFVRTVSSYSNITKEEILKMHDNLMEVLFNGIKKR